MDSVRDALSGSADSDRLLGLVVAVVLTETAPRPV
jgi:hypothetical protein